MRVTTAATYRKFTSSVNDVHLNLNKSMNKISSGAAYETAADSPLSYYTGKRIDNQYQDVLSKLTLIKDIDNRLYQQEMGARDIQKLLADGKNQVQYARTATTTGDTDIQTLQQDLIQKTQAMANDLNTQYQDFYVFGGNDVSTTPFGLSFDENSMTFTYNHTFPGEQEIKTFNFKFAEDAAEPGTYKFTLVDKDGKELSSTNLETAQKDIVRAMSEQGRIDIGYGSIHNRETLLDTYTGGLSVLTGLNSDAIRSLSNEGNNPEKAWDEIEKRLNASPLALTGRAALAIGEYVNSGGSKGGDKDKLDDILAQTIEDMTITEHRVTTVYTDLGNKSRLLEDTENRLTVIKNSLTEQYKDALGADPYAAILEMYNNQYSYNAALQVGSKLLNSSLFDFIG